MSVDTTGRISRRTLLGAVGAPLVGGRARATTETRTSAAGPRATFMTYNLYLGTALSELFAVDSVGELRRTVGRLFEQVRANRPAARMEAIADEIAAADPALVGIQEAALIRTDPSSDAGPGAPTNAEEVYADYLALLRSALADRGAPYDVATKLVTADMEMPATVDGARMDVRVTDRLAILARRDGDVSTSDPENRHYASKLSVSALSGVVPRGYCAVRATVGGADLTFVTTHLESRSDRVRREQARELVDRFGDLDRPVVVAGDLNSGPGGSSAGAYGTLSDAFEDAYLAGSPNSTVGTCCNPADLRSSSPTLGRRLDHAFVRGPVRVIESRRVGLERTSGGAGSARLWPSDHAGVVVTVRLGKGSAIAASGSDPAGSPATETSVPGFGVVSALVALGVAVRRLSAGD